MFPYVTDPGWYQRVWYSDDKAAQAVAKATGAIALLASIAVSALALLGGFNA